MKQKTCFVLPPETFQTLCSNFALFSSLFKVIAGRIIPSSSSTSFGHRPYVPRSQCITGQVTYNDVSASVAALSPLSSRPFHLPSLACFVGASDVLSPFLTVRETLLFAGACLLPIPNAAYLASSHFAALCHSSSTPLYSSLLSRLLPAPLPSSASTSSSRDLPSHHHLLRPSLRRALANHRTDLILSLLHLNSCQHTRVGDVSSRGISGGERRRVSLGEALMGDYAVTCFDEVNKGEKRDRDRGAACAKCFREIYIDVVASRYTKKDSVHNLHFEFSLKYTSLSQ